MTEEAVAQRSKRTQRGGHTQRNFVEALRDGLAHAMEEDDKVVVLGEDVGRLGGVFRVTQGLQQRFGADRVVDSPLSEVGLVGAALGMALVGLRPVVEIQFADFMLPSFDQILSEVAKYRYRSGGEFAPSLVIRTPYGGGIRGGHYHSQSPETHFIHTAGLKVVCPATASDAKGLLMASIADPDPVIFLEPKRVYRAVRAAVLDGPYAVPLGQARVVRSGRHVSCVAWGAMLYEALDAAQRLQSEGIEVEVVDLRTLWPLDIATLEASVAKTGRLVAVHEAPRSCGFGAELVALLTERLFVHLEAPPRRVTGLDTPFPYALEKNYLPLSRRIAPVLRETARFEA